MTRRGLLLFLAFALALAACGETAPVVTAAKLCDAPEDCPADKACIDGKCVAATCESNAACPEGQRCLADGTCAAVECEVDADCCPPGGRACTSHCVSFECVGSACTSGQAKDCFIGCHQGSASCDKGTWAACDAAPVTATETCGDGIDNDCNGKADDPAQCQTCTPGATQACAGPCGDGQQQCTEKGAWGACDAPTACTCKAGDATTRPCGNCGVQEGACGPESIWVWSEECLGNGACTPGDEDKGTCGACGTQKRVCKEDCSWGEFGTCESGGECTPNDTEKQSCGSCGSRTRTCGPDCTWGVYGTCVDGAGCKNGQVQTKTCGQCGQQQSTCNAQCEWGPFGDCTGQGACEPGAVEKTTCGQCGEKQRKCLDTCELGPWSTCQNEGPCKVGDVQESPCGPSTDKGLCEYGTKTRSCTATCQWGAYGSCLGATWPAGEICGNGEDEDCDGKDDTLPDDYEKNDSCGTCTWLGTDPTVTIYGSFDQPGDKKDFYCFQAVDNSMSLFEAITVKLSGQAVGVDGDVYLYKGYDACGIQQSLASNVIIGGGDETITWSEGTGADDNGTYIIEVESWGDAGCFKTYTLSISGLK